MTTAIPRTTPCKKVNLYFTFKFHNCIDLFRTPIALLDYKLAQTKYVMTAFKRKFAGFNSKWKYEKLAAVVRVLESTQNLVPSRCCFAEDGDEIC